MSLLSADPSDRPLFSTRLVCAVLVLAIAFGAAQPCPAAKPAPKRVRVSPTVPATPPENLNVPPEKICEGSPKEMMRRYLIRQVDEAVKRWKHEYERRKTPEQIAAYQKRLRQCFLDAIGGLPQRTPLNPRVTGAVLRPGYRVEKIVFESQPKHFVTGLLFLPDTKRFPPPRPGVLIPCGHSQEGKGYPMYQRMGAMLALRGMAAFVFDPIDQGERVQYRDNDGKTTLWGTVAHINVGMGCILLGQNTARFEIWDGMRAIDYLQLRPEVDPKRIGCTGNSGGGTQTSYLMALDDRVRCAAPSCYLTCFARLLRTGGPHDSEQSIFGQLAFGMDHGDLVMMRAPSPVLICTATHDFFDIAGTWETFRAAKRLYTRLGMPERVDLLEADTEHGYGLAHRQGAAHWMLRWLSGEDRPVIEPKIELLKKDEYECLPGGTVMKLPGARSVYDLNEDDENQLAKQRAAAWKAGKREELLADVRRLAGIRPLAELPKPKAESCGTIARNDTCIEELVLRPEPGIALPALLFRGPQSNSVILYLHDLGKAADAGKDGPIERLVRKGNAVLAIDIRGNGQTRAAVNNETYNPEYQDGYIAYLLGRSYVGMRAEDILVAARYAAERFDQTGVRLIAIGNLGVPALHAAALEPALFQQVTISDSLVSWANVIHHRLNSRRPTDLVHGALTRYDLPDLAAVIGNKLTIERPVDAEGNRVQ